MTHEDFFDLKPLSGSLGSDFSKTTENETVEITDIEIVKVDKRGPCTLSFKTSCSKKNYKKNVVVNN